jgi:hypothetical protein
MRPRLGPAALFLATAAAVAGCSAPGAQTASPPRPRAAVTVRVSLPRRAVAGSVLTATVTITNTTSRVIRSAGCGGPVQVGLARRGVPFNPAELTCLQIGSMRPGTTTTHLPVETTYQQCGGPPRPCPKDGVPQLPLGRYHVSTITSFLGRTYVYPTHAVTLVGPKHRRVAGGSVLVQASPCAATLYTQRHEDQVTVTVTKGSQVVATQRGRGYVQLAFPLGLGRYVVRASNHHPPQVVTVRRGVQTFVNLIALCL